MTPLTARQKATFLKAYRDTYAESDSYAKLDALYTKYERLYRVPRDTLLEIVTEDHRRNRRQYLALHAAREQQKKQRRKAYQDKQAKAARERRPSRKTEVERRQAAKQEAERRRALADPGYYTQATYCPVCRRNLHCTFMPPHEDSRDHHCQGSGRFGVTKAALAMKAREDSSADRGNSVRAVSGGLPGLGRAR